MERDDNLFYDENCNFLFVKTENDSSKLSDHVFIHKDTESGKGFMALFKSYDEDTPLEVYSLNRIPLTQLDGVDNSICKVNYSEVTSWKRLRIQGALPTPWKTLFEQIVTNLKANT